MATDSRKAREILEQYLNACGHSTANVKKWLDEVEAETIERCAQIADAFQIDMQSQLKRDKQIAAAIRALKGECDDGSR